MAQGVIEVIDSNTKESVSYSEVTHWHDGTAMTDAKTDSVMYRKAGGKYYKLESSNILNVKWFGAKGDGVTDDTAAIQSAFDIIHKIGGGELLIPTSTSTYNITETIHIGTQTTVRFGKSYLKLVSDYTSIGTLLFNKAGATNIVIDNPLLDGNNKTAGGTGENGISFGNGGTCIVYGGVIKNCKKGTESTKLGGKGIQVEATNVKSFQAFGTKIEGCDHTLSSVYDINIAAGSRVDVTFSDIVADDCGSILIVEKHNGAAVSGTHNVHVNNLKAYNCGMEDGLILLGQAQNLTVNGLLIKSATKKTCLIRGRHSLCSFNNVCIEQELEAVVDNNPGFHNIWSGSRSEYNYYDFKCNSKVDRVFSLSNPSDFNEREIYNSTADVYLISDVVDHIAIPQVVSASLNMRVLGSGKLCEINTLYAAINSLYKVSDLPPGYSRLTSNSGTVAIADSGVINPNGSLIGSKGQVALCKSNNAFQTLWAKTSGDNNNIGWTPVQLIVSGNPAPDVFTKGFMAFDEAKGRPVWGNGTSHVNAYPTSAAPTFNLTTASASYSQADMQSLISAVGAIINYMMSAGMLV